MGSTCRPGRRRGRSRGPRLGTASLAALIAVASVACRGTDPFVETRPRVDPQAGAVVSEHPLATQVGLAVLDAGGNAADAAVATVLALAVVYPVAGNLGGGGFAVWVPAEGEPTTFDFREVAPAGYSAELYLDAAGEVVRERSLITPLAVGVPGTPLGLWELYRAHRSGRLSFAQLCEGAISLAEDGFSVDPWLARDLASESTRLKLTRDPGAAALFYPGGKALESGDRLVQTALGRTLRRLAQRGKAGFYHGPVADAIVADLRDADLRAGFVAGERGMTLEDLAAYTVREMPPVVGSYEGRQVISMGPPSSGGVALLQTLGILEGLPLQSQRRAKLRRLELGLDNEADTVESRVTPHGIAGMGLTRSPGTGLDTLALHWWIEAMRCAFADRAEHLGDPELMSVSVEELLSPAWLAQRRVAIGVRANPDVSPLVVAPPEESDQTTHVSVLDDHGNAVSLTTTLNGGFGSGIYVEAAGFLLNNELDDFSIKAGTPNMFGLVGGSANQLAPGRRPLSSMTPTIVRRKDGRVEIVIGAPGGPRIITATTQVVLRMLSYEQTLEGAIRAPAIAPAMEPDGDTLRARLVGRGALVVSAGLWSSPAGAGGPRLRQRAGHSGVGGRSGAGL